MTAQATPSLLLLTILVIISISGCAAMPSREGAHSAGGLLFRELPSGSKYAAYVPGDRNAPPKAGWPAIVFLHGKGECGTDGQAQTTVGIGPAALLDGAKWPCIIVMPQKPDPEKQWEEYDAMVLDELAAARREWHIDPARITLTGLSQGGHGAWVIGSRHTDVFAAIAPICGYGDPAGIADRLGAAGTPVWAFHGLKDDVVSPDGTRRMVEAIREAREAAGRRGSEPRISLFPEANHSSWDRAYRQEGLAAWLLDQKKN